MTGSGYLRIGELARRAGVSPELLRAWERRYGLLEPARSTGGFRLYSDDDLERVSRMRAYLDEGLSAAQAARLAATAPAEPASVGSTEPPLTSAAGGILDAAVRYDEVGLQLQLDRLLAAFSMQTVLLEAVVPALRELGERWAHGDLTVAQEHFASNLIRGRLLVLARLWAQGQGPRALLACPPGELHDIGLVLLGLLVRHEGWQIVFLGADTPLETVGQAARVTEPRLVVLSTNDAGLLEAVEPDLSRLANTVPVALGGPGASEELATRAGAHLLADDLRDAAAQVALLA